MIPPTVKVSEQVYRKCLLGTQFYNFQVSTPYRAYTDAIPSNSPPLEPYTLTPSGEYIQIYCEQANQQNFHVWNSHRQHAVRLFQAMLYDRLFLSNS